MSKEERIQKIAKGVRLFRKYRTMNGSPISEGMFALDDIEFLLSELPQTVAETIDWDAELASMEASGLVEMDGFGSSWKFVRADMIAWLKSFVQRIHSPAPDMKLLEALEKIAECCLTEPAKGVDWEQQWWTNMRQAGALAESALTSYRERK